jgi:hypothetical protein
MILSSSFCAPVALTNSAYPTPKSLRTILPAVACRPPFADRLQDKYSGFSAVSWAAKPNI